MKHRVIEVCRAVVPGASVALLSFGIAYAGAENGWVSLGSAAEQLPALVCMHRGMETTYEAMDSIDSLGRKVDTIVVGAMRAARPGRTFNAPPGDLRGHHTYVVEVKVEEVLKGQAPETVYVERPRSMAVSTDELDGALQRKEQHAILFLASEGIGWRVPSDEAIYEPEPPLPAGTPLYQIFGEQGIAVEASDRVIHPNAAEEHQLYPKGMSFDAAIAVTRETVHGQPPPKPIAPPPAALPARPWEEQPFHAQ
jgi:hypothetical protein